MNKADIIAESLNIAAIADRKARCTRADLLATRLFKCGNTIANSGYKLPNGGLSLVGMNAVQAWIDFANQNKKA